MIKVKKILSVLFALLFITSFKYNDKYAYESVNYIKFSDFNKKGISYSRVPLINKIKGVYYNNYFSIDNYFFPEDESFVIKKFSEDWYLEKKDFIYDGEVIKNIGGKDFEIDNKEIFSILFKNNNGFLVPAFTERYKEKGKDYFGTFLLGVSYFDYASKELKPLFGIEDLEDINNSFHPYIFRLLDAKGEWLLVLGIYHNYSYQEVDELHNCFKIYKYNLKTKEVRIWDSRENNLTMYIDTYYLNYDLSKDRRYIYMSFMSGYSGYEGEKGVVSEGGVYIFDWWEEKFYKVFEPMPVNDFKKLAVQKMKPDGAIYYEIDVKVVNNTDDGYVYAMWAGTNEDFQYVRFKNPEEMLK